MSSSLICFFCYSLLLFCNLPVNRFKLGDKEWEPWTLRSAQQECEQIAQYCGTFADIGILATRQKFIDVLKTTTVLHIGENKLDNIIVSV